MPSVVSSLGAVPGATIAPVPSITSAAQGGAGGTALVASGAVPASHIALPGAHQINASQDPANLGKFEVYFVYCSKICNRKICVF